MTEHNECFCFDDNEPSENEFDTSDLIELFTLSKFNSII